MKRLIMILPLLFLILSCYSPEITLTRFADLLPDGRTVQRRGISVTNDTCISTQLENLLTRTNEIKLKGDHQVAYTISIKYPKDTIHVSVTKNELVKEYRRYHNSSELWNCVTEYDSIIDLQEIEFVFVSYLDDKGIQINSEEKR